MVTGVCVFYLSYKKLNWQKRDFEKAKEIARGLKRKNYPLGDISETTGIPLQEVEALQH